MSQCVIPSISDVFKELKIIDIINSGEVNDPIKVMVLNVIECHIPLMIGVDPLIGVIHIGDQVPVHNPCLPQDLNRFR